MTSSRSDSSRPTVVVIGAGIIGLACAIKLQDKLASFGPVQVLLVAREWPASFPGAPSMHSVDYASMWAGAHVRPIPATTPQLQSEARWLKQAAVEFRRQVAAEPWCGVTCTMAVEHLEAPDQGYRNQDETSFARESGLRGYRKLPPSKLPDGVVLGYEYETYCINSPVYCGHLLRRFLLRGGKTMRRVLKSEWEAFSLRENTLFVVNASGVGFGDPKSFPTRGQTVVTDLAHVKKTVTRQNKDGTWSFLIPRFFDGGTVVGGTKEPGDWRVEPDLATRNRLLVAALNVEPFSHDEKSRGKCDIERVGVISDVVGRRPTREGGMRLEVEERAVVNQGKGLNGHVVHAYGAGGRGYEICWGVANEVVALASPLLQAKMSSRAKL
ncbi:hypothetical protein DCS_03546 [Drechmeria coniospora]|uniref:FAD dependent oxidoreductase domain-containing protein n=1 Tax=Drechmeria coniospora TaxID=98403 RepID=A0A151GHI7_DRECN|nr:hypothetical protein DCS_03546 [Drechmeria coniospora]KYK56546.1 hypothetical protein DCS_03546 [Drechmeria coniospora]